MDLSRRKIDVCLLSGGGEIVEEFASPPDAGGLLGLNRRVAGHGLAVRGVIDQRRVDAVLEQERVVGVRLGDRVQRPASRPKPV